MDRMLLYGFAIGTSHKVFHAEWQIWDWDADGGAKRMREDEKEQKRKRKRINGQRKRPKRTSEHFDFSLNETDAIYVWLLYQRYVCSTLHELSTSLEIKRINLLGSPTIWHIASMQRTVDRLSLVLTENVSACVFCFSEWMSGEQWYAPLIYHFYCLFYHSSSLHWCY